MSMRLVGVGQGVVRGKRRDAGEIRLTDRDLWAMRWIGEQYAIRMDQLGGLLGSQAGGQTSIEGVLSERRTRRIVERWRQAGFVETRKILYAEPGWVWLSRTGLRAVGLQVKYLIPRPMWLSHVFWCAEVRRRLEAEHGDIEWRSDRLLHNGGSTVEPHHLPDAEIVLDGVTVAIEVELTQKHLKRLVDIVAWHPEDYQRIRYYVSPAAERGVGRAIEKLTPERQQRFDLIRLDGA
ncbi:MAG: hypothetical protein GXP34_00085 [Actinobacteria bacterium]|nr:hypothetical protein [Actinomycetota bacterium]